MAVLAQGAYAAESKASVDVNNQQFALTPDNAVTEYFIQEDGVTLRTTPSLSGAVLGELNEFDIVYGGKIAPVDVNGDTWVFVYSQKHNATGWIICNS